MDPPVPADAFSGPFSGRKRDRRKETMKSSNRRDGRQLLRPFGEALPRPDPPTPTPHQHLILTVSSPDLTTRTRTTGTTALRASGHLFSDARTIPCDIVDDDSIHHFPIPLRAAVLLFLLYKRSPLITPFHSLSFTRPRALPQTRPAML